MRIVGGRVILDVLNDGVHIINGTPSKTHFFFLWEVTECVLISDFVQPFSQS